MRSKSLTRLIKTWSAVYTAASKCPDIFVWSAMRPGKAYIITGCTTSTVSSLCVVPSSKTSQPATVRRYRDDSLLQPALPAVDLSWFTDDDNICRQIIAIYIFQCASVNSPVRQQQTFIHRSIRNSSGQLSLLPSVGREMSSSLRATWWKSSVADWGDGMSDSCKPRVHLFVHAGNGWPHSALWYH